MSAIHKNCGDSTQHRKSSVSLFLVYATQTSNIRATINRLLQYNYNTLYLHCKYIFVAWLSIIHHFTNLCNCILQMCGILFNSCVVIHLTNVWWVVWDLSRFLIFYYNCGKRFLWYNKKTSSQDLSYYYIFFGK